MKNIIIASLAVALLLCSSAFAQSPTTYKVDAITAFSMPSTTINVSLVVTNTTIKAGPYARFAQKFLGIVAPLTDKNIYSIGDAVMSYSDANTPAKAQPNSLLARLNKVNIDTEFALVTADRMVFGVKSPEDLARDAANELFTLRKRRFDLITGEAGENVFGAGLASAIQEMSKLENEILELFIGKKTVTKETKTFNVTPSTDKQSYIVARFSETGGLLNDSDLSGSPVVLSINVEPIIEAHTPKKEAKYSEYYQIAAMVNCKIVYDTNVLASERIPVLQLGKTVSVGVSGK